MPALDHFVVPRRSGEHAGGRGMTVSSDQSATTNTTEPSGGLLEGEIQELEDKDISEQASTLEKVSLI
jgi:hypothetical protein